MAANASNPWMNKLIALSKEAHKALQRMRAQKCSHPWKPFDLPVKQQADTSCWEQREAERLLATKKSLSKILWQIQPSSFGLRSLQPGLESERQLFLELYFNQRECSCMWNLLCKKFYTVYECTYTWRCVTTFKMSQKVLLAWNDTLIILYIVNVQQQVAFE